MTNREAISKANDYRPNNIPDELKAEWLMDLEEEIAEMMDVEVPDNDFPAEQDMLCDDVMVYVYYLGACIDQYNQETELYANDAVYAQVKIADYKAKYRRQNRDSIDEAVVL